ncbi:MAG: hypothetical protein OEU26_05265 [Candidatus Tectomicrobia bacterium]|nr:hypothetical protein [Candidatus Tectomicrobia bacterium]
MRDSRGSGPTDLAISIRCRFLVFTQAARFSGLNKSAFCKFLRDHFNVAAYTLDDLSKKQAKQLTFPFRDLS